MIYWQPCNRARAVEYYVLMKKIRFGDLVRQSGRPSPFALWTPPDKNPELQRAIKANRVLTVRHQSIGTKRDVGQIGFREQRESVYLVFPRRLPAAKGPVVGINYELLEQPALAKVQRTPSPRSRRVGGRRSASGRAIERKEFSISVRAVIETFVEVVAKSATEARTMALASARNKPLSAFHWRRAVARVSK